MHPTSVVADMPKAKTICELGFNLGHGASTILASLDRPERFYAFDLGEDVVEKVRGWSLVLPIWGSLDCKRTQAVDELRRTFTTVNITLTKGRTEDTVPSFVKNFSSVSCDLVHIDAGAFRICKNLQMTEADTRGLFAR